MRCGGRNPYTGFLLFISVTKCRKESGSASIVLGERTLGCALEGITPKLPTITMLGIPTSRKKSKIG